jgi:hypothetical protein
VRVIKINVDTFQVEHIDIEGGLQSIYDAIGNGCTNIEAPYMLDNHAFYMDGEILIRPDDIKGAFEIDDKRFVNSAIIVGTDNEGNDTDCTLPLFAVATSVEFLNVIK